MYILQIYKIVLAMPNPYKNNRLFNQCLILIISYKKKKTKIKY